MNNDTTTDVPVTVSASTQSKVLPWSFLESQLYDRMSKLLEGYLPVADIRYMLTEIKQDLFAGFTTLSSQQLHTVIHHCVKCTNVVHPAVLPSWNCVDPDLYILVENPAAIERYGKLLFNALKEVGFSSNRCMLTHATRCKATELTTTNFDNCVPYLHTELAIVNPKLVLTLGLPAFSALTFDSASKLTEIRGLIRSWGVYSILPEISLGSLSYANEKDQRVYGSFFASLQKAFNYCYPQG